MLFLSWQQSVCSGVELQKNFCGLLVDALMQKS